MQSVGKFSKSEIRASNLNLCISLILMSDTIRTMREEKTDRAVDRVLIRPLDEETLERLKIILGKIEEIRTNVQKEYEEKVFNVGIEELCTCPVHLKHLRQAGIVSLRDFLWPEDPVALHRVLHEAENETEAVSQPHLFELMPLKFEILVKKIWGRNSRSKESP